MRLIPIVTGEIYHIFNRGVNKGDIFFNEEDYRRFYLAAIHYKTSNSKFSYEKTRIYNDPGSLPANYFEPRVQVLAYCFMPNHFHFLIKQLEDGGLTSYIQHLTNSYVHYINVKYKRVGPLFQGRFKNVPVMSDEQLLHLSRYIHLNPLVVNLVFDIKRYQWSSALNYIDQQTDSLVNSEMILGYFKSREKYLKFMLDQVDYGRQLEISKHLLIDN